MFEKIWGMINNYYFFIIAIPCMSMFPFKFKKKYKIGAILIAILITSFLWGCTRNLIIRKSIFHTFGVNQSFYIIYIICACCILYSGNPYSMILTVLLSMSLALQCGFIFGNCIELAGGNNYEMKWIILRDILGYGMFLLYYFILWKHYKLTSFYMDRLDHIILIVTALINFLFTCLFSHVLELGSISSIMCYMTCLFLTCSVTFLIFRFTQKYQQFLEQQAVIQDMKLSENILSQIQVQNSQMKELKHELSNYFIYAKYLLEKKEYKDLSNYLADLSKSSVLETRVIITNNLIVNSILNQKNAYAKILGIKTEFQIALPDSLGIDDLTLCSLLGNILDNAIEACKNQEDSFIHFYMWTDNNHLIIKSENSTAYDILKENSHLFTTKKDADFHGNGFRILKRIIKQYNGILHYEMVNPNCFSINIVLEI